MPVAAVRANAAFVKAVPVELGFSAVFPLVLNISFPIDATASVIILPSMISRVLPRYAFLAPWLCRI